MNSVLPGFVVPIGLALARLSIDAAEGRTPTPGEVARRLVKLGLELVPHDELQRYLTEAGIELAESAADATEAVKFATDPLDEDELP